MVGQGGRPGLAPLGLPGGDRPSRQGDRDGGQGRTSGVDGPQSEIAGRLRACTISFTGRRRRGNTGSGSAHAGDRCGGQRPSCTVCRLSWKVYGQLDGRPDRPGAFDRGEVSWRGESRGQPVGHRPCGHLPRTSWYDSGHLRRRPHASFGGAGRLRCEPGYGRPGRRRRGLASLCDRRSCARQLAIG